PSTTTGRCRSRRTAPVPCCARSGTRGSTSTPTRPPASRPSSLPPRGRPPGRGRGREVRLPDRADQAVPLPHPREPPRDGPGRGRGQRGLHNRDGARGVAAAPRAPRHRAGLLRALGPRPPGGGPRRRGRRRARAGRPRAHPAGHAPPRAVRRRRAAALPRRRLLPRRQARARADVGRPRAGRVRGQRLGLRRGDPLSEPALAEEERRGLPAAPAAAPLTVGVALRQWWPLAGGWLLMTAELTVFAAIVARMPDPIVQLAAWGVVFAVSTLVQAPSTALLPTATALARDRRTFATLAR